MKKIHLNRAQNGQRKTLFFLAAKKKKLTLLFALLCASVMGFATTYCHTEINATNGNGSVYMTCSPTANENEYKILFEGTNSHPLNAINAVSVGINNINGVPGGSTLTFDFDAAENGSAVATFTCTSTPNAPYVAYIVFKISDNSELVLNEFPKDMDWTAVCGGSSKPSPELSLNATSITLEKDVTAETFQIVPTKTAGSGDISYSSNAEGVATVSNTGLVTAVGPGTATITVSVAENEDFAADSKTLTVEVIDWTSIAWLTNSNDSYKLYISPAMGGDGQRIEGSNLWVGFPSAELGAMSIVPSGGEGAWRTFALSNFPGYRNQFTVVCQGTTYTFTIYRKFDGVNLAKGMPTYAGATALPKAEANDGNKGSRWASGGGAKHYPQYGDVAEDWWVVDLGAMYEINAIKTLYEGATPKNYSLYTSPNNDSWIEIDSYNAVPQHVGNTDADYNEYTYSPGKVGRYVKIFAREAVQADFGYGISIWEFEVYGQPAENVDVNAPVLASAAVSGTPTTSEIKIAVSASDTEDGEISLYRVRESTLKMDRNFTAVDGKLTFGDLLDGTDYTFTITALDNIGNQSNAIVVNASTAQDPANPATMAPEPPVRSADDVRAIYSDAYADILMHDFQIGGQWGSTDGTRRVKNGNNYLLYDISSNNWIALGVDGAGKEAIVAKDGYHGDAKTGLNASEMEQLHIDLWSNVALAHINVYLENTKITTVAHDGTGWNQYNIELPSPMPDAAGNLRFMKLDGINDDGRAKIAIDNIYFFKAPSGSKTVEVSTNNALWGSVTATAGGDPAPSIVPINTEVTFTATPTSDAYDFAYWLIGEEKVYTNPYPLVITANTNAEAIFEPHRTTYCRSVITADNGATIYMTAKKTGAVQEGTGYPQYRLEFEGMAGYAITGPGNFDVWIGHVNGSSGNTQFANGAWTFVDNTSLYPYGMLYAEFYAEDWREITFPNHYFFFAPGGVATLNTNFPTASLINWNNSCIDETAPVLEAPVAKALNESTIRLSISATDDYSNTIWYHITCAAASIDETITDASGVTITKEYTGLTSGTLYEFTVTAADGSDPATANVSDAQDCSATPVGDTEDPVITSFTATASYGYVDLAMTATDDMAGDLTYTITYGTDNVDVVGAAGSETTKRIFVLPNTSLSFSVVATDAASHTSAAAVADATTLTIPASHIPTHEAVSVLSVFSNTYEPAVAAGFNRTNWGSAPVAIEDDYILYTMSANTIVWGNHDGNAGHGNIDGLSGKTHGETPGLDVSGMKYIHFDIFCDAANQLNTVNINDQAVAIPTTRTIAGQWVSFDVDITGVALADRQNLRWLKFHPFNTVNCIAAIDNVYFWKEPDYTRDDSWMAPGELGTICIPNGAVATGGDIYELVGKNEVGKIVFATVPNNEMTPGKPYLFQATSNSMKFYYTEEATAENPNNSGAMKGTFDEVTLTGNQLNNVYYFAGHALWSCVDLTESGLSVPANRAWVVLDENMPTISTSNPAPGRRYIYMGVNGQNAATGFGEVQGDEQQSTKVLINGHLFIRRGEKTYDATGRLVK